jgi:hypothetical protein
VAAGVAAGALVCFWLSVGAAVSFGFSEGLSCAITGSSVVSGDISGVGAGETAAVSGSCSDAGASFDPHAVMKIRQNRKLRTSSNVRCCLAMILSPLILQ